MACVSHDYEFVYIKTHKTASTSAEMALEPFCAPEGHRVTRKRTEMIDTPHGIIGVRKDVQAFKAAHDGPVLWHHMPANKIRSAIGRKKFDAYTKVACVRNPFKRLLSQFAFQHRIKEIPMPETIDEAREKFIALFPDPGATNRFRTEIPKFRSDFNIVTINGELALDTYFRSEHLAEDIADFLESRGIPRERVSVPTARENATPHKTWPVAEFFNSDEIVNRVIAFERWVFDFAGYSTDPADA